MVFLILILLATPAFADLNLSSPGPLSKPHAKLDSSSQCGLCHEKGKKITEKLCLDCHKELKSRVDVGLGFHGRMARGERDCASCHPDHAGRELEMVFWKNGIENFDHEKTGYTLNGAHADASCESCHDSRLIQNAAVKAMAAKLRFSKTFLGLSQNCSDCHFDEHRGQVSTKCETCHGEKAWKPAEKFNHNNARFRLTGKHRSVECAKCHKLLKDKKSRNSFPAPKNNTYLKFTKIPFQSCQSCHEDVHKGQFGAQCENCHKTSDWRSIHGKMSKDKSFHEKTRYPLRGAHKSVSCTSCHGKGTKNYKVAKFSRCSDCHIDAHLGQISRKFGDCDQCHTINSFSPSTFKAKDHRKTKYKLEGAHKKVECKKCHYQSKALKKKIRSADLRKLKKYGRNDTFSLAVFKFGKPLNQCETCHQDIHQAQFSMKKPPKTCAECHSVTSFKKLRFNHQRDSRYPLTGKHRNVDCNLCHYKKRIAGKNIRMYRPIPTRCESCHEDIHVSQFARKAGKRSSCDRCHTTEDFQKVSRFDHNDSKQARFPLEGRHSSVDCENCHRPVQVTKNESVVQYKRLPLNCFGCHVDEHKGAFTKFIPVSSGKKRPRSEKVCETCHTVTSWSLAEFDHSKTPFPLKGAHQIVRCAQCHREGNYKEKLSQTCGSCHQDVHAGQLGTTCTKCHDESTWKSAFSVQAHRRTNFPLVGRHALIPCEECHVGQREKTFTRAAMDCYACHEADYLSAATRSIDHEAAGFGTQCRNCHSPLNWTGARFLEHETCFPISRGDHARFSCNDCHTGNVGFQIAGTCTSGNTTCTGCHTGAHSRARTDDEHDEVPGYQYKDRKCYECHNAG